MPFGNSLTSCIQEGPSVLSESCSEHDPRLNLEKGSCGSISLMLVKLLVQFGCLIAFGFALSFTLLYATTTEPHHDFFRDRMIGSLAAAVVGLIVFAVLAIAPSYYSYCPGGTGETGAGSDHSDGGDNTETAGETGEGGWDTDADTEDQRYYGRGGG